MPRSIYVLLFFGAFASMCLTSTVLVPNEAVAQEGEKVIVAIDGLVFEEPDDRSRVVLRVRAGEQLDVVSERGDWIRVQLPRGTGWVLRAIVREKSGRPKLAGFGDNKGDRVTVVADYADIKAGPGDAYLAIKRVFQGDSFAVKERSKDGKWIQIQAGDDLGWIQADQVLRSEAVFKGDQRDRKTNEPDFEPDSRPADPFRDDADLFADKGDGEPKLTLRLCVLAQFAAQEFDSNSTDRRLDLYETQSTLFGLDLGARYWIIDYFGASVDYATGFGLPIQAEFDEAAAELTNSTHRLHAKLIGRLPFGEASDPKRPWISLSVGGLYHQFSIQETTIPLFLPNTYIGLRVGLGGSVPLGPVTVWADGWWVLGGSLDQGELTSGEQDAATWFGVEGGGAFALSSVWDVYLKVALDRNKTTFVGEGTRAEGITEAVNRDQFISVSTGLMWRPL